MGHAHTMLQTLPRRWSALSPDARRHLLNAAVFGITLDGGIATVLLNLYVLRLGFGPEFVGLMNAIGMFVFALSSFPGGRLGERFGLRRVMLTGIALCLVGSALGPASEALPDMLRPFVIIAGAALINLGLGFYYANGAPWLMATTAPSQRTNAFSVQSAMYAVAGFAGSILGGNLPGVIAALTGDTLAQPAPYRWTLLLIPVLLALPLRAQWRMREPDVHATIPEDAATAAVHAEPAPRRPLPPLPTTGRAIFYLIALFSLVRFLQVGGVGAATTFFNVYMDRELHVATGTIGLFQAMAKLLGVPIALAVPALARRYGNVALVLASSTVVGLSLLPMAWVPVWWVAGLSYIGIWIVTPVRYTAYTVFAMERTPPGVRGTMNGAQEMLAGLSFALIAFAGGFVINRFGYAPLFTAGAVLTLVGVWLLAEFIRRERSQARVTSPSP